MSNTTKGVQEEITQKIYKPNLREIQSRPLKDEAKQIELTRQARAMLERISSLENNTEAAIKML